MGDILVGTSGYSYDDWKGSFYPEALPKEEFLRYYSLFFPFAELNFSYYAMPTHKGLSSMAERTPTSFGFTLKAHRSLTHEVGPAWRDEARTFVGAAAALAERDRLLAVLVQLPFSFHHTPERRRYLADLLGSLSPLPLAVEFRNDEWQGPRVEEELERRGVGVVMVDRPELAGLPPQAETVTGKIGYVRFHGRNEGAWWDGDATSRYDYLYSPEELETVAPRLKRMASKARLLVAFNNHARGNAPRNASELKAMIARP